jgi:hypothetical protein
MRHPLCLAALAVFVSAFVPPEVAAQSDSAAAPAPAFSVAAELQLVSRYIWRGYDDARKAASLQPYVEVGMPLGVTISAWGTSGLDRHREVDELDFTLDCTHEFGAWAVGAGYLYYVLPGTLTEPGPNADDPLASGTSGEVYVTLARAWEDGSATLTYARGNRAMRGNSVNLRVEQTLASADEVWSAAPYVSVDYLDEYGAPQALGQRFSMVEVGIPVARRLGPVKFLAAAHVSFIPSAWVRDVNAEAGADRNVAIPWFSIGVAYEPD